MHTVCIGLIVIADVLKSGLPEDGIENISSSGWYRLTTGNWNELCIKCNGTKMNITQYYDTLDRHITPCSMGEFKIDRKHVVFDVKTVFVKCRRVADMAPVHR